MTPVYLRLSLVLFLVFVTSYAQASEDSPENYLGVVIKETRVSGEAAAFMGGELGRKFGNNIDLSISAFKNLKDRYYVESDNSIVLKSYGGVRLGYRDNINEKFGYFIGGLVGLGSADVITSDLDTVSTVQTMVEIAEPTASVDYRIISGLKLSAQVGWLYVRYDNDVKSGNFSTGASLSYGW